MSIVINGKENFIIDRTLMNITEKNFNKSELLQFSKNLKRIGVDLFEIDEKTFNMVKPLIKTEAFIFRIDSIHQLEICKVSGIKFILIKVEILETIKIEDIEENYNFKIMLEIDVNLFSINYIEIINKNIDLNRFFSVRLKGVSDCFFNDYLFPSFKMKKSIYASDKYSMATAVGFQAILKGFDYITTAFCGKDGEEGTTSLEEILVSTKVIMAAKINIEISLLSEMRAQYEKITYVKVLNNKPVIGKNIFKYESGVHVAGIEKNPVTYEPFMPELVGLQRKLALGKHSGKKSIYSKLKELGIDSKFNVCEITNILNQVKCRSIVNKMEISDMEFIDICRGIGGNHHV